MFINETVRFQLPLCSWSSQRGIIYLADELYFQTTLEPEKSRIFRNKREN